MRIDLSQLTPGQVSSEQNTKKVSDQQVGAPETSAAWIARPLHRIQVPSALLWARR